MARTVIISDTHLANPTSGIAAPGMLRPIWQDADRLIINGDTAELHHPTLGEEATRLTIELQNLCERDGVDLTLIAGNHDPFISDERYLRLANGAVFVTHGDVLHPAIAPWSENADRLAREMSWALSRMAPEERHRLESRLRAAQHASHMEWLVNTERTPHTTMLKLLTRPVTVCKLLHYWWRVPKLAEAFMQSHAPTARFLVLGHTHRQGIWHMGERVIVNTGSFGFPARPRAIVLQNSELLVHPILRRHNSYVLAPRPIARFTVASDAANREAA